MFRISAASVALLCLFAAAPAVAEDFAVAIDLPKGSVILLTVEKKTLQERNGQSASQAGTFRYRQEISPTETGYTVRQVLTGLEIPGLSEADIRAARALTEASVNLTYEADQDLAPARIPGWEGYVDNIITKMTTAGALPDAAAVAAIRKLYASLTPEDGAAQLKEQNMIAVVQMAALDLNKPLIASGDVESPLGGPPIRQNFTAELTALNKAAGTATIKTNESLDKDSLAANLKVALPLLMAQIAPDAPKPTAAELASIKFERTTDCVYEMDLKTGLTRKADCINTETGLEGSAQASKKVERFTMTQVLQGR